MHSPLTSEGDARAEPRFRALATSAPVGIYELDARGNCVWVNEHWCELAGVEPEAALERGWMKVIHPDDLGLVIGEWDRASEERRPFELEYRYLRPDGDVVWIVGRAVAVREDDEVIAYLGTAADVSDRVRAQQLLDTERRQLAHAQRIAKVGSWEVDPATGQRTWSEQQYRNLGFDPSGPVPSLEQILERVHPDDRDDFRRRFDEMIAGEAGELDFDYRVVTPDGEVRTLEVHGGLVSSEGDRPARFVGTTRDVTSERAAELMRDEFFSLVSHELRTPLTSIIGYAELLEELESQNLSEQGRRFVEVIERNSRRELKLVGDLLMLTRISAGTFEIEAGRADLTEIARAAVEAARPLADKAGVELAVDRCDQVVIRGDRHRLGQVADNLISNAIKFTPSGGRVAVELAERDGVATLAVADTGIGIAPEEIERLFERMYRSPEAERRHIQGIGLGLTVTKAIVDAHGGAIHVASEPEVGTTFTVELPVVDG